jgi:hypothetical protein
MQSFYLLLPSQNQIANHEEFVLDIAVIIPAQALQIFSRACTGVKAVFLGAINLELSYLDDLSLSWFLTHGD